MKFIFVFIILTIPVLAQTESKQPRLDSSKTKKIFESLGKENLTPLGFGFSVNNSEEINLLINNLLLTEAERKSGLSDEELTGYMKNKVHLKSLMKLPPNEAEEYPTLSVIRKVLGAAKTVGVIIILLLSIL
ncbi:MAG: hypothetical protein WCZ90_01060 [Melioribacteraceae bacterium]